MGKVKETHKEKQFSSIIGCRYFEIVVIEYVDVTF